MEVQDGHAAPAIAGAPSASPVVSALSALQSVIESKGWPAYLLPPDPSVTWTEQEQASCDAAAKDEVSVAGVLSQSRARQTEIWHVEWANNFRFTMAPDSTVTKIEGVSAGAAHLKGIKLKVVRISHSKAAGALDFYVKPPYLPGFTVTPARRHFDSPEEWKA